MGRIDEALRRGGHIPRVDIATGGASQPAADAFVSPWAFREGADLRSIDGGAASKDSGVAPRDGGVASNPLAKALDAPRGRELHSLDRFSRVWMPRLVIAEGANRLLVEEFRQLAATLHQAQVTNNIRVLMVTSAEPGEGKSTTAVNLALTFSESYQRRVLLVDADLRRPTLHEIAQVPNQTGLGETLKATSEHKLPLFQLSETLMLAPAGKPDPNPMGALTSPRMRDMLVEASLRFDWVIIDAPPIGLIADSSLLAPLSDGVLLVVRARRTHHSSAQKAVEAIGRERILGVVLNDAEVEDSPAYHRYYHSDEFDDTRQG
jgi:capsular exopolysaccharide synthesis family protein